MIIKYFKDKAQRMESVKGVRKEASLRRYH